MRSSQQQRRPTYAEGVGRRRGRDVPDASRPARLLRGAAVVRGEAQAVVQAGRL